MTDVCIGVVGATGALGGEILRVLADAPWKPENIVPLASSTTKVPHVEISGRQTPVEDLDYEQLVNFDVVMVCAPAEVGARVLEACRANGVSVVDCSGAMVTDPDVPLVWPALDPAPLSEWRSRDAVSVASPTAAMIAMVIRPLVERRLLGGADATVYLGASTLGREGIQELSEQVIALFNGGAPPRRVFERGLAFDLLPAWDDIGATGWSATEVRTAVEVARLAQVPCTVTAVGVPVFSGISASVRLTLSGEAIIDQVEDLLRDAGVQLPESSALRAMPRPRSVEGDPRAHAGRVRLSPDGRAVHLWLTMDNLRATATAAVACCGMLVTHRGES